MSVFRFSPPKNPDEAGQKIHPGWDPKTFAGGRQRGRGQRINLNTLPTKLTFYPDLQLYQIRILKSASHNLPYPPPSRIWKGKIANMETKIWPGRLKHKFNRKYKIATRSSRKKGKIDQKFKKSLWTWNESWLTHKKLSCRFQLRSSWSEVKKFWD